MEKTKILFVTTGLNVGGAERSLFNLVTGDDVENFNFTIISLCNLGYWGEELKKLKINVETLELERWPRLFFGIAKLVKLSRSGDFDVIQGWMYHGNFAAFIAWILCNRKPRLFWSIRQTLYDIRNEKLLTALVIKANRFFSKYVSGTIYNSELSKAQHERIGFDTHRSHIIPNGFEGNKLYLLQGEKPSVRKSIGLSEQDVVVGHVARFHPMKNHRQFIRVAEKLLNTDETLKFVLVGKNVEKNCRNLVQERYRENILFYDETSAIFDFYKAFDIFCLCSSWGEGFPNVLAEAMLHECACVTTNVGDAANILGKCGWIVEPNQDEKLQSALSSIISLSFDERDKLGKKSRQRILKHFSMPEHKCQFKKVWSK